MSKELEKLIETTNKIQTCLVGDKLTGQVGALDKIDCIGEDMCEVKDRLKALEESDKKHIKFKKPSWLNAAVTFLGFYKS